MRDPDRIPAVMAKVEELWRRFPDWRLGQLMVNVVGRDPFFIEEDELIRRIDEMLKGKGPA